MKKKYIISFITFLTYCQFSQGQSFNFTHYQVENGLSNNSVHSILQDSYGFMWFGTKDGLNRFDGYTFKVFRGNPNDSTGLGSNIIQSLYENNGQLWVGTDKGLYEYDSKSENLNLLDNTTHKYIRGILKDDNNNLWFISDHTLNKYNLASKQLQVYPTDTYFSATSLCITPDGTLWIVTTSGTLHKYDPQNDSFQSYDMFENSALTSYNWIEKIYSADNHSILIGTQSQGIKIFDINTATYEDVLSHDEDSSELFVRDFVQYSSNEYWVATESGLYIYDVYKNTFTNLKKSYNNPYSISDNAIYSVYKDKEGGVWAGTYFGGVNYYPKQYTSFEKFFPKTGESSLSGNAVRRICQDRYGNFWIGTEDAGLNKYDPKTGEFTNFKPTTGKTSLSHYNIHGLLAIGDELWIGTFHHGLDIMDILTGKVIRHYEAGSETGTLKSNFIYSIYQTRAGDILVGTSEGLFRYNPGADNFTALPESSELYPYTTVVLEDEEGTIWGGTFKEGVYYFNPQTEEKGYFKYDPEDINSISNNGVNSIFQDSNKNLWFATENGLNKFISKEKMFERYTTSNGLPSNVIYEILEDHQNYLWISTSKGLGKFNPHNESIKIFTKAHGLLSDQLNYSSAYKTAEGKMYFGSVKGMVGFSPAEFIINDYIPPVYITGFQVQHQELPVGKENSPLRNSITHTDKIILTHNQSSFSLDFAALSYTAPEMTEYVYTLEGLDNEWTTLKTNRKIYFTELAPGAYTFKVKATNSSGVWNDKAAQLNIEILPPFW
ncbi:MAG: hybrid sensor histidine kinase/response regulator, partial [Bacteroidota bacterium]|nr:hybrid sensor histidine kinase/response regulator [Bacteroidota bacterium]